MKYVIVQRLGMELAIIFHEIVTHCSAVNRDDLAKDHATVLSAGMAHVNDEGRIETSGQSTSLGLKPRPQDAEIIEDTLLLLGLWAAPKTPFIRKATEIATIKTELGAVFGVENVREILMKETNNREEQIA